MGGTPISDQYPCTTPGSYVVSAGDSLRGIALALFGDAQLWYLIADANGLKSDADLTVGQNLTIPNKVTNLHNTSATFKPYAPGEIIGDTTPTLPEPPPPPKPKKKKGCGGIGKIIVMIVAIVATVFTAGAMSAGFASLSSMWTAGTAALGMTAGTAVGGLAATLGAFGTGLVAGAVGSIVSQGVGIALGVQDKFSWGAVAVAGISAGLSYGLGEGGIAGSMGIEKGFTQFAVNGAVNNTITQGVSIAVGLQDKFSWKSVAASALGAGIAYGFGQMLPDGSGRPLSSFDRFMRDTTTRLGSSVASQLVYGGKANWANVAADAFGNALGNSLAYQSSAPQGSGEIALANAEREAYGGFSGNGISVGGSEPGLRLRSGEGLSYQSVPVGDEPTVGQCLAPDDWSSAPSEPSRFTAQKGDTVWKYAGGDLAQIGAFTRLNGLRDADAIVTGREYLMPNGVSDADVAVGQAQARLWQTKAEVAAEAASANRENQLFPWLRPGGAGQGQYAGAGNYAYASATPDGLWADSVLENPVWKGMVKVGSAPAQLLGLAKEGALAAWDVAGYGVNASLNALTGLNQSYVPDGALARNIEARGWMPVVGDGVYAVANGLATPARAIVALGNHDWETATEATLNTALMFGPGAVANGTNIIRSAETAQIVGGYNTDLWISRSLTQGDVLIGMRGTPPNIGQSAFYTDVGALRASNMSYQSMAELTQVAPNPRFGLRSEFGVYEVQPSSMNVAAGRALANTNASSGIFIGKGGATQYFIPSYQSDLKHLYTIRILPD